MQIKQSTAFRTPVRLVNNISGVPVTGVTYTQVTVYIQQQGGTSTVKTLSGPNIDWFEIDSVNMPGVYDLNLHTGDTSVVGFLKYSVVYSGVTDYYIGIVEIVANIASDIYTFLTNHWRIDTVTNEFYVHSASVAVTGMFYVQNGQTGVTATLSQTGLISIGALLTFGSQPGITYPVSAVSGTSITLETAYTGTTAAAATANQEPVLNSFYLFNNTVTGLATGGPTSSQIYSRNPTNAVP